jgi:hypothetical protein
MPFVDAYGMEVWSVETVFKELFERMLAHETWVEAQLRRVETAMSEVENRLARRIAACERRTDDVRKEHGGPS